MLDDIIKQITEKLKAKAGENLDNAHPIHNFADGDFVCWERPDRGEDGAEDTRAGALVHGRVAKHTIRGLVLSKNQKKGKRSELLAKFTPEQLAEVKEVACEGNPIIEELWDKFVANENDADAIIAVPEIELIEHDLVTVFEIKPGICDCGCGGLNYAPVTYEPQNLRLEPGANGKTGASSVCQRHNLN